MSAKKLKEDDKSMAEDDEQVFKQEWGDERDGPTIKGVKGTKIDRGPADIQGETRNRSDSIGTDDDVAAAKKEPG